MLNIEQNNEEQFQMLLMTLEDVQSGICILQSDRQHEWIMKVQHELKERKIIIHDIAKDPIKKEMITSADFRDWASDSDAQIIIVYNMQLLGIRYGDEEAVEKLNFMRDQIQEIGKLFLFGMTPFFSLLLSQNAVDLYSCILHNYRFQELKDSNLYIDEEYKDYSGSIMLNIEKYSEYKKRISNGVYKIDNHACIDFLDCWITIRDYLNNEENYFIKKLVSDIDLSYSEKTISVLLVEDIWTIANVWDELEQYDRGLFWYKSAHEAVKEQLGTEDEKYAEALTYLSKHYFNIGDFVICEKYCDEALKIYKMKNNIITQYSTALNFKAVLYRQKRQFQKAIEIYNQLLESKKNDSSTEVIINNIGRVYEEEEKYSDAIIQYQKALDIVVKYKKKDSILIVIYNNIASVYLKSGDLGKAWINIKKAKKYTIELFGDKCSKLIHIYNLMSGICNRREKKEEELGYLERALEIIKITKKEESESASYVYHNLGNWYMESGEYKEALLYFKKAIEIRKRVYTNNNEITASSLKGASAACYFLRDMINCRRYGMEARTIFLKLYGKHCSEINNIDEMINR